jgi:peptidoglycan/xylan/chitin deacetylase (PgdA/CDA1 family)
MEITRQKFLLGAASALLIPQVELADAHSRVISKLPASKTKRFAWTIDDGMSSVALGSYLNIAEKGEHHLTLFVTSSYGSWKAHSKQITRLLSQGKIQLGNHTLNHKDLTTLSSTEIKKQLDGCHKFILEEFGYDARPYFRPTYGNSNVKVRSVAADLGYTVPTMWYGSFGDTLGAPEGRIIEFANKWLTNGRIVIDHSNRLKSQKALNQIQHIAKSRGLRSVTLTEAFGKDFK